MQTPNDEELSPDYRNPLEYFSSHSLSQSTPIYAEDPWNSSNGSIHFNNSYTIDQELTKSFIHEQDNVPTELGFGSHLNANNVLLGVEVPRAYYILYDKTKSDNGKITLENLHHILSLAGLSIHAQQLINQVFIHSDLDTVSQNEFNAYMALIGCAQHNMDISLNTIYTYKNDLPIPTIQGTTLPQAKPETLPDPTEPINRTLHLQAQHALNRWLTELDQINLTRTSQKEGFLFKHVNYQVESEKLGSKVLRRFSDFWWLWEILLKRYPFRIVPNLPPKKLGGRNEFFEESRRKGLTRFINAVVRHPVLGTDEIVHVFLSHPSELSAWKRTNFPSTDEEFVRKTHDISNLERLIPMDLEDRIIRMKKRLSISIQQYERMCYIMNQMNRLKKALGTDFTRYSITLNAVSGLDQSCWVPECKGCPEVVKGYDNIAKSMHQAGILLNKQAILTGDSIVDSLKSQKDLLESFRELLDRRDRAIPVTNEILSRNMAKYKKGEALPSIAHDAVQPIQTPSKIYDTVTGLSLVQQRELFIKYCIVSELSFLHKQQANVSTMYNRYVRDEIQYTKQWSEHWKGLESITNEMPNTPHEFL